MFLDYIESQGTTDEYALTAARHIDMLTYFRITDFEQLTAFQQRIVRIVHAKLTEFEKENEDILDSTLTSYSINGVSMSFGKSVKTVGGVTIPSDLYTLLLSTGLCYSAI